MTYVLACILAAVRIAAVPGWRYALLLPAALLTLHLSHGCGFLSAVPTFVRPWPSDRRHGSLALPPEPA
jgi:hypothetical protein